MLSPSQIQSAGGTARKEKLAGWERAFVAMLGGSKRPIIKDRRVSAEQVVHELKQEGVAVPIPWNLYVAVGMDGTVIPSSLDESSQLEAVQKMDGVAGFVGLIKFNGNWRTYTRKLLLDPRAQTRLNAVSEFFIDHVKNFQIEEIRRRGQDAETSLLSAQVYVDTKAKTFSMYYSFHPDQLPEPDLKRIGIVYLLNAHNASGNYQVPAGKSPWLVRYHFYVPEDKHFVAIMKEAERRFQEVVDKIHDLQVAEIPKR